MILNDNEMSKSSITAFGKFSVNSEFKVQCANETFYTFLGNNSCYAITELIHKEDVQDFIDAAESIQDDERRRVVVRFVDKNGLYELFMFEISLAKKIKSERCYDIMYNNIVKTISRNSELEANIRKYRRFLEFEQNNYFDYNVETDEITVYMYVNGKSLKLFKDTLTNWYNNSKENGTVADVDIVSFETLYANIKHGMSDFMLQFSKNVFVESDREEAVSIKGSVIFMDEKRKYVIGSIVSRGDTSEVMQTSYYLSEAGRDSMTGLYNKKAMSEYITERLVENRVDSLYFVVMDIDDFKQINDTYGHMFGDIVIKKLAEILKATLVTKGVCGRFGGDEFVIAVSNIDEMGLRTILKTVSKNLMWYFKNDEKNIDVTLSMGISRYPDNGNTYERLFEIADRCLYIAKQKGKNRYIIYKVEKHGVFNFDDAGDKNEERNYVTQEVKTNISSKVINELYEGGFRQNSEIICTALSELLEPFEVDGITVYKGEELTPYIEAGRKNEKIKSYKPLINEYYVSHMKSDGVISVGNLASIQNDIRLMYNALVDSEISMILQCATICDDDVKCLVSFNCYGRKFKRSTNDIAFLTIIGNLVCKIVNDMV